jgi:hypothetical protein
MIRPFIGPERACGMSVVVRNRGHKTRRISNKTEIGQRTCTRTPPVRRAQGTIETKQKPITVHGRTAYRAQANFMLLRRRQFCSNFSKFLWKQLCLLSTMRLQCVVLK